jgi:hypothetical protein
MNEPGDPNGYARRSFLLSSGGILSSAWLASQWPEITAAHDHAAQAASMPTPTGKEFLSADDAADVDAIAAQIVPSGETAGAREAHVIFFIDRSLATFFSDLRRVSAKGWAPFKRRFEQPTRAHPRSPQRVLSSSTLFLAPWIEPHFSTTYAC